MGIFFRLVRFPAVFTVLADSAMGFLFTCGDFRQANWTLFIILSIASVAFYWTGMALNDLMDVERDKRHPQRRFRPIASGELSVAAAQKIIGVLFSIGLGCGFAACVMSINGILSGVILLCLILAIILYDSVFKFYWFAPFIMGSCRIFNIFFAMSLCLGKTDVNASSVFLILFAYGVYITGVTWFARYENIDEANWNDNSSDSPIESEASPPQQTRVQTDARRPAPKLMSVVSLLSALTISLGVLLLLPLVDVLAKELQYPIFSQDPIRWKLLMGALSAMVGVRALQALVSDNPAAIGPIVGYCLLTLIVLDAIIISLVQGPVPSICVVGLLIPAFIMNQFTYMT